MTIIKIKSSTTANKAPSASDITAAELAINLADKKLYSKDAAGTVFEIGNTGAVPGGGTGDRPSSPSVGDLFYDTTLNALLYWNGSEWEQITSQDPAGGGDYVEKAPEGDVSQNISGPLTLGTDKIELNATDGSATFAGSDIALGADGSASFASGQQLFGTSNARADLIGGSRGGRVQIEAASSSASTAIDNSSLCLTMGHNTSAGSANIFFTRTKSNSLGGVASVSNDDILGGLYFQGTDSANAVSSALIKAEVDGTPGTNDMPSRIVLSTRAAGGSSPAERFRVNSSGALGVGGANFGSAGQALVSKGSSAAPTWEEITSTFTQNGTDAVERTVESKLTDVISVFDFMTEDEISSVTTGTVDGSASFLDVTSALQAAINAAKGKQLVLPPGIYHISSTLTVPKKSWLQGTGASALYPNFSSDWVGNRVPSWGYRATTIQYLNGHGTIFDSASDCKFDGLVIRNHLQRNVDDRVFDAGTHFKFTNCVVQNMNGFLPADRSKTTGACIIDSCQFTACTRIVDGVFLDAKVVNSTFVSFTETAFTLSSGAGLNSFIGNRFDFCEGAAIRFMDNSRNNRIIGNNFDAHARVALQFEQAKDKNIIANNHFWRCGRNQTGDENDAFVKLNDSSNQYFVGNLFIRDTPDSGAGWKGPEYVIGLENCINTKNFFVGNNIDKNSCFNRVPVRDKIGNSVGCIDIDSIFIGDDSGGDIGDPAERLGRCMTKPTVCYITESKTVTGYAPPYKNLILTGAFDGFTFSHSGGGLTIDKTSKIDNITYGGRYYYVQDGQQYANGAPSEWRSQGTWPLGQLIYYQVPTTHLGTVKTASGSPDTWGLFAEIT